MNFTNFTELLTLPTKIIMLLSPWSEVSGVLLMKLQMLAKEELQAVMMML